jgi:phospholipid-binding lipoprotein MlaA
VGNFFGNLQDAWSFVNHVLQFKIQAAGDSMVRFGVNTFFGLGGILDIATEMNIEKNTKDFGHTLGYWGMGAGPYLVLPLLGPSSARDAAALTVTWQGDLLNGIDHVPTRNSLTFIRAVDLRASLLQATKMLEEAALDKYSFTRDAYLQSRRSAIFDGNPPEESSENSLAKPEVAQFESPTLTQTNSETLSSSGIAGEEKVQP